MTRSVPTKTQIMKEIAEIIGSEPISSTAGSSIPRIFFSDVAAHMGIPQIGTMTDLARRVIEFANLQWHEDFSSELTPSGGGGTVTALGLLQMKNAVLKWKGLPEETLPSTILLNEWEPAINWLAIRNGLPKEETLRLERPGASDFRKLVLDEYQNKCAITRIEVGEVIEVAHIVPYYGEDSDHIQNGIPMRVDLHKLFDSGLLRIRYIAGLKVFIVEIHENAMKNYKELHEKKLELPGNPNSYPSKKALEIKQGIHAKLWVTI